MKPNKENIRKWVDALRSRKYPQDTDMLRTKDGFCCLGVATDLAGCGWRLDADGNYCTLDKGKFELPRKAQKWLGLTSAYPKACGMDLSQANDDYTTFDEIADLIETEWLETDEGVTG